MAAAKIPRAPALCKKAKRLPTITLPIPDWMAAAILAMNMKRTYQYLSLFLHVRICGKVIPTAIPVTPNPRRVRMIEGRARATPPMRTMRARVERTAIVVKDVMSGG